jgi:hypothetical protein
MQTPSTFTSRFTRRLGAARIGKRLGIVELNGIALFCYNSPPEKMTRSLLRDLPAAAIEIDVRNVIRGTLTVRPASDADVV